MRLYEDITQEVEDSPEGPGTIAFFDLDGTLIFGFSILSMFLQQALSGKVAPVDAVQQLFSLVTHGVNGSEYTRIIEEIGALLRSVGIAGAPDLADALDAAGYIYDWAGQPADWIKALSGHHDVTRVKSNRIGALLAIGQIQVTTEKLADARRTFEKVLALSPEKEALQQAKGYIFEIDHLQIGMEAPDFTTKTVEGNELSLKSFRGKTVLLNFWASW